MRPARPGWRSRVRSRVHFRCRPLGVARARERRGWGWGWMGCPHGWRAGPADPSPPQNGGGVGCGCEEERLRLGQAARPREVAFLSLLINTTMLAASLNQRVAVRPPVTPNGCAHACNSSRHVRRVALATLAWARREDEPARGPLASANRGQLSMTRLGNARAGRIARHSGRCTPNPMMGKADGPRLPTRRRCACRRGHGIVTRVMATAVGVRQR